MMKKITIVFAGVLLLVFILLSMLSINDQYAAEQKLWKTNSLFAQALKNPESTPENIYQEIIADYQKINKTFTDVPLVRSRAIIQLGRTYIARKNYLSARKAFQQIFVEFPNNTPLLAEAAFSIGKTFEIEGNWKEAKRVYDKIIVDYPTNNIGLSLPLLLASHYIAAADTKAAAVAFKFAENHYSGLIKDNPKSATGLQAMNLLVKIYVAQEEWSRAIGELGKILLTYPDSPFVAPVIQSINTISLVKLQESGSAERIYERFMKKYPEHKLNKALKEMLKSFKTLNEKARAKVSVEE